MSREVPTFKMATGATTEALEAEVNRALGEGYTLVGAAFPVVTATRENGIDVYFVQSMIREAPKDDQAKEDARTAAPRRGDSGGVSPSFDRGDPDARITEHWRFDFGKYKGMSVRDVVLAQDSQYIRWAENNIDWFNLDEEATRLLEDAEEEEGSSVGFDVYDDLPF